MPDRWNVDIWKFPGIDEAIDVTEPGYTSILNSYNFGLQFAEETS
jgi:hypothetical protein